MGLRKNTAADISANLSLGATSAPDSWGQRAGPTAALVAQLLAQMDDVWNNTSSLSHVRLQEQNRPNMMYILFAQPQQATEKKAVAFF